MSQQNVEVVRRFFEAFDPDVDRAIEFWHPDLDYRAVEGALDDVGVFYGHEALRHYWEQMKAPPREGALSVLTGRRDMCF